ncbi:MAG: phosphonate ABC transporter, permease protein PhnE [Marinospirillum sp.]|uniref:phosphonate ABC transporter, permease protein PhnE n=1 Tax=Marinospirillum sp. TaxID=2183934 RepID=UPI0019EE17FA|nr:phosphonate ABC transporter, permease protein PhnE [Marinospirillum sp.]MBE0507200.1 phosphonate ABC transporter, permease protein PhnE [Marinospirillum sp.]
MNTSRPVPVPPPGGRLKWHLSAPYSARHVVILALLVLLLVVTGQRTEMDRMLSMTGEAVLNLLGVDNNSQVVRGLSSVADNMWPPVLMTQESLARMTDFDADNLPMFSRVEQVVTTENRLNPETYQLESTESTQQMLVKPLGYVWVVLVKMVETLEIAFWGTILAVLLSIPLSWFAARNYSPNRFTYTTARSLISLLRSAPELIVALFLVLAYGFGPIAGVLALGLHAAGFLGKFYAEDIENADKKPQEALEAIGAGKIKTLWYGVLPQVLPQYIAYTAYILDRNLRMATVIGLVGAGGIGQELKGRFDMYDYGHVTTILISIFVFVFVLDQISARIRARMI